MGLSWGRVVHQVLEAIGSGRVAFPLKDEAGAKREPVAESGQVQEQKPRRSIDFEAGREDKGREERGTEERSKEAQGKDEPDREAKANLDLYVENLLVAEERDIAEKDRLIALVDSIVSSEFWQRVMRAEKRYFEIPFSIKTTESELSAGETGIKENNKIRRGNDLSPISNLPVILTGTIDLVFWENGAEGKNLGESPAGGWIIADYKTDVIPGAAEIFKSEGPELTMEKIRRVSPEFARIIDFYTPHVRLYSKFWSQITGRPVKESGLYFTSLNRWINIFEWMEQDY